MTMHRITAISPWKVLGLVLMMGWAVFLPSAALAVDSTSPLFHQEKTTSHDATGSGDQMALPEETPNPSPGVFSTLLRLFLALIIIVALIVATVFGLKLMLDKKGWNAFSEEGKSIRVLTSTFLAPRKSIHLVEIGKRILVIGAGNEELTCLDVITDPAEIELLRQTHQQGFQKIFNKVIRKQETDQQHEEAHRIAEESKKVVDGYVKKLKRISKKSEDPNDSSAG
jgi:flagellar biogenesis protein FliO